MAIELKNVEYMNAPKHHRLETVPAYTFLDIH